jgi:FtsP/CotA-like multicopper oxidase with cupredoxin domain
MLDDDSTLYDSYDDSVESHDEADEKAMLHGDKPDPRQKNRALLIICVLLVFICPILLVTVIQHPSWTAILKYEPDSKTSEAGARIHGEEIQAEEISISSLVNTTELGLKTGFTISDRPMVREYEFHINHGYAAPDGFRKLMILVNGQSPGPVIEANVGDTIRVLVHNDMKNTSSSIHWHGLDQRNSTWMDGVLGVSQCAIPPGQSFTYEFRIIDQRGTYWYHAHTSVQYTDGLFGAIIIHDPHEQVPPYSDDQILFIGDHYHAHASTLLRDSYLLPASVWSPDIPGVEPLPDNFLLNGQHVYDCSVKSTTFPSPPDNPCSGGALAQTFTQPNTTVRLRLISHSSFTSTWFSIDNHTLTLVEIDGVEIAPMPLRGVYLNVGQRLSVLVNTSNAPGSYHMRATMPQSCFVPYCPYVSSGLASIGYEATALLSYGEVEQGTFLPMLGAPGNRSNPYGVENNFLRGDVWEGCDDMPFDMPKPAREKDLIEVGERNKHEVTFRFQEVGDVNRIFINRVSWLPISRTDAEGLRILTGANQTSYSPLKDDAQLWKLMDNNITDFTPGNQGSYSNWGLRLDQQVLLVPDADEGVQIAINSKDLMEHPFHAQYFLPPAPLSPRNILIVSPVAIPSRSSLGAPESLRAVPIQGRGGALRTPCGGTQSRSPPSRTS